MDKRTLYALLAKPVRRWEFLLGKFGGLGRTLAVNTAAMAAGTAAGNALREAFAGTRRNGRCWWGGVFHWLKLALVVALALLFACFTTPLLAILFTVGLYIVGLYVQELRNLPVEVMRSGDGATSRNGLSYLCAEF